LRIRAPVLPIRKGADATNANDMQGVKLQEFRRNKKILEMVAQGTQYEDVAKFYNVTRKTVTNLVYKHGGIDKVRAEFGVPEKEKQVLIAENDLLNYELKHANTKLAKNFIALAMSMNEKMVVKSSMKDKFKFLQILAPIVKSQVRELRPANVNFFVGGKDAESLERKLLEYATKPKDES
jgi:hypothetical protein